MVVASATSFYRYLWQHQRTRSLAIAAALWLSAVLDGFGLSMALPLLTQVTHSGAPGGLSASAIILIILGAFIAKAVIRWLSMWQVANGVAQVARELRNDLFNALVRVDWRFFVQTPAGHLSSAAGVDAYRAAYALRRACGALAAILQLAVYLALIAAISFWVGLGALALAGLIGFALRFLVQSSRRGGQEHSASTRDVVSSVMQFAHALKPARSMARDRMLKDWLRTSNDRLWRAERHQLISFESVHIVQEPLAVFTVLLTLFLAGAFLTISGPQLLLIGVLLYRMLTQAKLVQTEYQGMLWATAAFDAIQTHAERARAWPEARVSAGEGKAEPAPFASIHLRSMSFGYGDHEVIDQIDLVIPAGSMIVLTGVTGSGKSTLLDLLAGLYVPTGGSIEIDERPLQSLDLQAWRRGIGYMTQEPALLHDTVRRNVTLGEPVDEQTLEWALTVAGARDFVRALPDGLETVIGEQGFRLSGGQRQRLALARALVGRPRLLLLDEPTANVDPETEAVMAGALVQLKGSVTIVVASHRPVFESDADRVLALSSLPESQVMP